MVLFLGSGGSGFARGGQRHDKRQQIDQTRKASLFMLQKESLMFECLNDHVTDVMWFVVTALH